jgi:hypothetical protein
LINSRSNSASPPSTVNISQPCGVVVSALGRRLEAGATLADLVKDVEKIPRRPGQPIKPANIVSIFNVNYFERNC